MPPAVPSVTPAAIIDKAAEVAAMRDPIETVTDIKRASAIHHIHEAPGTDD
jgi:hypothetical protein